MTDNSLGAEFSVLQYPQCKYERHKAARLVQKVVVGDHVAEVAQRRRDVARAPGLDRHGVHDLGGDGGDAGGDAPRQDLVVRVEQRDGPVVLDVDGLGLLGDEHHDPGDSHQKKNGKSLLLVV
ncbi:hypothetical protein FOCC_FOCC015022 [Frankliniella occidentalis]|nr:hypothetical protein FOCC_FOCC015022 [Frankliniella occidentalis]